MKLDRTTPFALLLACAACVSPTASVSDLTGKSLEGGNALANADRATSETFRHFVSEVEQNELALLKEMRRKIEKLTVQAMREKVDARRARLQSNFDGSLWTFLTEELTALVEEGYEKQFRASLDKEARQINDQRSQVRQFPEDRVLRRDLDLMEQTQSFNERAIQQGTLFLHGEAARALAAARRTFELDIEARFTPYEDLLVRVDRHLDESFSSILTEEEVELVEPQPISYDEHLATLEAWNAHTQGMHTSHIETLDTIDRYMKGRAVTLLFLEGVFEDRALVMPPPPTVDSLGLSELVVELRAKEAGLEELMGEVEASVEMSLLQVNRDLTTLINAKRREVEANTQFSE